jgi:hypothetical protein
MQDAAAAIGTPSRIRLETLPGASHSFADCMAHGLGERVFEHIGRALPGARPARKRLAAIP